jgi:alpha-glucoside transport system substrate-binding protein
VKSLVWYVPENFEEAGYKVPKTMEELQALTEKIVADGGAVVHRPRLRRRHRLAGDRLGRRHDAAHAAAGTYDKWVTNEIPFNDPAVVGAIDEFGKFAKNDKYVDGGAKAVASTDFRDSPKGLFAVAAEVLPAPSGIVHPVLLPGRHQARPGCRLLLHADLTPRKPELGKPVLGAGTLVMITKDSKAARAFIEFLKTPIAHEVWMAQSSFLTPLQARQQGCLCQRPDEEAGRDPDHRNDLPLRRFRPDARQDRRRRLLDRHGRLCRRQVGQGCRTGIQKAWDASSKIADTRRHAGRKPRSRTQKTAA